MLFFLILGMDRIVDTLGCLVKRVPALPCKKRTKNFKRKRYIILQGRKRNDRSKEARDFLERCKQNEEIYDFVYERCNDDLVIKIPQRRKNAVCEISEDERIGMKILLKKSIRTERLKEFGIL